MKAFNYVGVALYFDVFFIFNWQERYPQTQPYTSQFNYIYIDHTADYSCVLSVVYVMDI